MYQRHSQLLLKQDLFLFFCDYLSCVPSKSTPLFWSPIDGWHWSPTLNWWLVQAFSGGGMFVFTRAPIDLEARGGCMSGFRMFVLDCVTSCTFLDWCDVYLLTRENEMLSVALSFLSPFITGRMLPNAALALMMSACSFPLGNSQGLRVLNLLEGFLPTQFVWLIEKIFFIYFLFL